MSISDLIVVMKEGVVQQIGKPQDVYDSPANLFVAKFLGTPPINLFYGQIRGQKLFIGEDAVFTLCGIPDQEVSVGVRPEGFQVCEDGPLCCDLKGVEVMGRDISVLGWHKASLNPMIRAMMSGGPAVQADRALVRFSLNPAKVLLFHRDTEERIDFEVV